VAAGAKPITNNATGRPDTNTIIPVLFDKEFNSVFAGIAFAAIGIGALVPAAIMSIAAANLFARNIYKEYLNRDATPQQEAKVSKITSLLVKVGAVLVILGLDPQFSIDLQLIGGVIILQTLPAIVLGLYTAWFHRWALLAGWAVGLGSGLLMLYDTPNPLREKEHFGGPLYPLSKLGIDSDSVIYTGLIAVLANLAVVVVGSFVLRAVKAPAGVDSTHETDYHVEAGDPQVDVSAADTGDREEVAASRGGPDRT
jgi:SSS family solute:Na+ symporter